MRLLAIRESVWLNAPPGSVWRLILSLEDWPRWNPAITRAVWRGARGWKEGNRFRLQHPARAMPWPGSGRISLVEPHRELRWKGWLFALRVESVLEVVPEGCGTRVNYSSHYRGLAARLAARSALSARISLVQRRFLECLRCAGERVGGGLS